MNIALCTKILNAQQLQQTDQYTIENEPISSIELMERASQCFVQKFITLYSSACPVAVFCGIGNNGGDGLAIARLLLELNYKVQIYIVGSTEKGTQDFKVNLGWLINEQPLKYIQTNQDLPVLVKESIIIDALFGSGLSRGIEGLFGEVIDHINAAHCAGVVAVDMASGLGTNQLFDQGKVLKVSETITFQNPRLSHLLPQNAQYSGEVHIIHIGLKQIYIDALPSDFYQVNRPFVQSVYKKRAKYLHKGEAGHALIVAGSLGKMGAAVLSAKACLRAGVGLLSVAIPSSGVNIMQTALPEAMVEVGLREDHLYDIPELTKYDAIGVGPGLGMLLPTMAAIQTLIEEAKVPLVIDADALNILSISPDSLPKIPKNSIITPHPGEFKRLVGEWKDDYHRLSLQVAFAKKHQLVVVLKGANTSIAAPDGGVFFNTTGNPGMATAGSGDVLTGVITALVGQGYQSLEAAILAVYLHGLSGDLFSQDNGEESLIASDLIDYLPKAFKTLEM